MKTKGFLFLTVLTVFFTFSVKAQDFGIYKQKSKSYLPGHYATNPSKSFYQKGTKGEVQIGDQEYECDYPIHTWFNYSYTQTIYTAEQIGAQTEDITKIWYYFGGTSLSNSNQVEIYMANTTKTDFNDYLDFFPISDLTKVYDGTFSPVTGPGWIEFKINNFSYTGDNLLIAVHEKQPGYDGSGDQKFYCTRLDDINAKRTLLSHSDDNDIDLNNPTISSFYWFQEEGNVIANIRILFGDQQSVDLGVSDVYDDFIIEGENFTPKVTVTNYGATDQSTYSVNLVIEGTNYNETVNVSTPISNGENVIIDMPTWTNPDAGTYNFTATVTLSGDTYPDNDVMTTTCDVVDPVYNKDDVWTFCSGDPTKTYGTINKTTGAYTVKANADDLLRFFACADYVNGVIYAAEYKTNNVYQIIPDGRKRKVGTLTGLGTEKLTGYAYDPVSGETYVLTFYVDYNDPNNNAAKLYTVGDDWVCTLVGTISSDNYKAIAFDNAGHLYAIESSNGKFVSINPSTAEPTVIGDIGYSIDFAQDIGGDHVTGEIYGTIFDDDYFIGRFGKFDVTTGAFTQISELTDDNYTMCAVISEGSSSVKEVNDNISVFPNPSKGTFIISVEENINAEIIDVSGKIIQTKKITKQDNIININKPGIYFIKLSNNKGTQTFKVIVNK